MKASLGNGARGGPVLWEIVSISGAFRETVVKSGQVREFPGSSSDWDGRGAGPVLGHLCDRNRSTGF